MTFLKETQFAQLNQEQIKEIIQLEEKLQVTLLAYDHYLKTGNVPTENNTPTINPS